MAPVKDDAVEAPKRLLVLGQPRTGTTLLVSLLRGRREFALVHAEPLEGEDEAVTAVSNILQVAEEGGRALFAVPPKVSGCRATAQQLRKRNARVCDIVEGARISHVVVVVREKVLDVLVSQKIARQTGVLYSEEPPVQPCPKVSISPEEFEECVREMQLDWEHVAATWGSTPPPIFISYELLANDPVSAVHTVWKALGLEVCDVSISTAMVRQHPAPLEEKVEGWEALPSSIKTYTQDVKQILSSRAKVSSNARPPRLDPSSLNDSPTRRLLLLGAGLVVFHCLDSIFKEMVLTMPGFHTTATLSFFQALSIACFAMWETVHSGAKPFARKAPLWVYLLLGAFSATSYLLTNRASVLLNYASQVVFKSSKLLWVMLGRVLFLRGKPVPPATEWASAVVLVLGLCLFSIGNKEGKPIESLALGVISIVFALCCDAGVYVVQEGWAFGVYGAGKGEVILWMQLLALAPAVGYMASMEGVEGLKFAVANPSFPLTVVACAGTSYMGTRCILQIVQEFNSNTAAGVTSVRKLITILLSYLLFPKPFTLFHFAGLVLVLLGANGSVLREAAQGREAPRKPSSPTVP